MKSQEIQTNNKFVVLELEDGEMKDNNELALLATSAFSRSPNADPHTRKGLSKSPKKLNPKAPIFNPKDNGNGSTPQIQKETTSQWVNRTFGGNLVTKNRSCQDTPSQTVDTSKTNDVSVEKEQVQLGKSKLWSDQVENVSEKGEAPIGMAGEAGVRDGSSTTPLPKDKHSRS